MKKLPFTVLIAALLIACNTPSEKETSVPSPEAQKIEAMVLKQKEIFEVPGLALGMMHNDSIIFANAFGVQGLDKNASLSTQSIFHMASVSKPFVATAIVQLVERDRIDLDEKLTFYLPYFTMADERYKDITIRQMLSHTSGIPDVDDYEWDNPQYDEEAVERFTKEQKDKQLDFAPGTEYSYSNTAFDILCDVIWKVTGMTFEAYTKEYIFKPVGMVNSTFFRPEVDMSLATSPHVFGEDMQKKVSPIYPYNRRHAGSSTLHSNVEDMLRWARVNLNKGVIDGNRIYSEASYELLTTQHTPEGESKVGLSWFLGRLNDAPLTFHSGGDTGYSTFFGFMPETKSAIVMMANTDRYRSMNNSADLLRTVVFKDTIHPTAPIALKLKNYILTEGIDKVKEVYFEEKQKDPPNYSFRGGSIDDLGYWLIDLEQPEKALEVFLFNTELEPEEAGWVDSVADAYRAMNDIDTAIEWYEKALEMKPDQGFSRRKLNELLEEKNGK